eukprot:Phypoly_transcript_09988.p1 GENE.Phypoly_transcript_09988~~Phypoly_transcript_09988.p1  ORF type:complete len:226 (+),score=23.68 Phypoly_transcript_09988:175-852(+)
MFSTHNNMKEIFEDVMNQEIRFVVWLQKARKWVFPSYLALVFHYLIKEEVIMIACPVVMWVWDYRLAAHLLRISGIVELANGVMKWIIRIPRPVWLGKGIVNIKGAWEEDYSTPSSHAMLSASTFVVFIWYHTYIWGIALGCSLLVLVGLARVYVGVHYPHDIILGWLFAGSIAWGYVALAPIVFPPDYTNSFGNHHFRKFSHPWQSFIWLTCWVLFLFGLSQDF